MKFSLEPCEPASSISELFFGTLLLFLSLGERCLDLLHRRDLSLLGLPVLLGTFELSFQGVKVLLVTGVLGPVVLFLLLYDLL